MTIRSILRSIDARLARLEQNSKIIQCCGNEENAIPIVVPRRNQVIFEPPGDGRCNKIARLLYKSVIAYNKTIEAMKDPLFESFPSAGALAELLSLNLVSAVRYYFTQSLMLQFIDSVVDEAIESLKIVGPVNLCRAAREYLNGGDVVAVLAESASDVGKIAFQLYWGITGGVSWAESVNDDELPEVQIDESCCLPDTFTLAVSPVQLVCGNDVYSVDAVTDVVPFAPGVLVAPGVVLRRAIAGRYLQQVQSPSRFNLWLWFSDDADLSSSCSAFDIELSSGVSYRVSASGSTFLLIRNRAEYEGTYLTCTLEPEEPDNVVDI